jgi:hypothetical protein
MSEESISVEPLTPDEMALLVKGERPKYVPTEKVSKPSEKSESSMPEDLLSIFGS